jgi:hypothetical protein
MPPDDWGRPNEGWVAYQQNPGFVRDSQATDSRSAVLHAPLEPSPTVAHDNLVSSTAGRSADLSSLHTAEPASTPSVWMSGARKRVMQVLFLAAHSHADYSGPHVHMSILQPIARANTMIL